MSENISAPQRLIQYLEAQTEQPEALSNTDIIRDQFPHHEQDSNEDTSAQDENQTTDDELKAHIIRVQADAYEVQDANGSILVSEFTGSDILDIGSYMGTDAPKLVPDGYPLQQVVTGVKHPSAQFIFVPLLAEFANLGHKLFKTTQETYPIAFVPGDVFDPNHLEIFPLKVSSAQASTRDPPSGSVPDLRSLTSLNPLRGRVFAIHASSFFHSFSEEKQLHLARALAGLPP
ncbi:hypothetical protein BGY98DRAFT_1096883 [Russula aff. rugulosa BPL654]|nr:hypothetical protein BGY98DRAFT_1096883 [Russula aff. rugulosa BPL654]